MKQNQVYQAQVDWGELGTVEVDGKLKKLFCFNMILGYSRMRYAEFTLSIDNSHFNSVVI